MDNRPAADHVLGRVPEQGPGRSELAVGRWPMVYFLPSDSTWMTMSFIGDGRWELGDRTQKHRGQRAEGGGQLMVEG
jgi:hypothetical protein